MQCEQLTGFGPTAMVRVSGPADEACGLHQRFGAAGSFTHSVNENNASDDFGNLQKLM
jgi:hypothetical protein